MSLPCADSTDLKTNNAQNHSLMSTSLRDRLKKCGRYHPPSASLRGSPTNIPLTDTRNCSPSPLPTTNSGDSVRLNEAYIISENDADTPKRRTPETFNDSSTGIIKKRKLDYGKRFASKASKNGDQTNVELSEASSSMSVDISLGVLRNDERQTNDVSVSRKTEQVPENSPLCLEVMVDNVLTGNNITSENYIKLKDLKIQMEKELKAKEELIRKLKMVKMYREKNNLTELQKLIDTWRDVSQKALVDLHDLHPPPRPSLTELINHLQIDHELIHYNAEDENFS